MVDQSRSRNYSTPSVNLTHNVTKTTNGRIVRITPRKPGEPSNGQSISSLKTVRLVNVKPVPQPGVIPTSIRPLKPIKKKKTPNYGRQVSFSSSPPEITISNVICTFSTRCGIDLRVLARIGHNVELKPGSSICYKKLRNPFCTANISSTGKITCIGSNSLANAYTASRKVARSIMKLGFPVRFGRFRVVNVFVSTCLSFGVDIYSFHNTNVHKSSIFAKREFESEMHPGATYSFKNSSVSFIIFSTGSLTATGVTVESIEADLERLYPYLMEFATERVKKVKHVYNGKNKKLHFISKYLQSSSEDESFESDFSTTDD